MFEVRKANVVEEEAERKMKLRVMWASLGARPKVGSGEARRSEDIRRDKKRQIEKDRRDEDRRREEERQRDRRREEDRRREMYEVWYEGM